MEIGDKERKEAKDELNRLSEAGDSRRNTTEAEEHKLLGKRRLRLVAQDLDEEEDYD